MRKIYFDRRCIAFCQKSEIPSQKEDMIVVTTDDIEQEYNKLFAAFRHVEAGGGLVTDGNGKYLLIHRNNVWDLPKGHRDEGESLEECALREVKEETGASALKIKRFLCDTRHCYFRNGIWHLKNTFWYEMTADSGTALVPQADEGIAEAVWASRDEVLSRLANMYPSIVEVFEDAGIKK